MHIDWQALKETAWKYTQRFALFWLAQSSLVYLWASVVAGRPITPVEMVRFCNHMIQWRTQRAAAGIVRDVLAASPPVVPGSTRNPASQAEAVAYIRTSERVEVMDRRDADARVVAVLDAKTPVRLVRNKAGGWKEIEEVVPDGSHPPAHGFVQAKYIEAIE